jgi:HEAT repeat protein
MHFLRIFFIFIFLGMMVLSPAFSTEYLAPASILPKKQAELNSPVFKSVPYALIFLLIFLPFADVAKAAKIISFSNESPQLNFKDPFNFNRSPHDFTDNPFLLLFNHPDPHVREASINLFKTLLLDASNPDTRHLDAFRYVYKVIGTLEALSRNNSESLKVRNAAIELIVYLKNFKDPLSKQLLQNDEKNILDLSRPAAMKVIADLERLDVVQFLEALFRDKDPKVRIAVIENIVNLIENSGAFELLKERLEKDKDLNVLVAAIESVGWLEDSRTFSLFKELLQTKENETIRLTLIQNLILLEDSRTIALLKKILKTEKNKKIRAVITKFINNPNALEDTTEEESKNVSAPVDPLRFLLNHPSEEVRKIISNIYPNAVPRPLLPLLQSPSSPVARAA